MNLNQIITDILVDFEYSWGFIGVLLSLILVSLIKILETVKKIKLSEYRILDVEKAPLDIKRIEMELEEKYIQEYIKDNTVGENTQTEGIMELSSLADGTSIFVENAHIPEPQADSESNITDSIKLAENASDIEIIENQPDIENFKLFTNPEHIFSGALQEIFNKKLKIILNQLPQYRFSKFPFFKLNSQNIELFYLDENPDVIIEEVFELWRMGYSHPDLAELFIHYLFSIKSEIASKVLLSVLHNQLLSGSALSEVLFLYKNILNIEKKPPQLPLDEYAVENSAFSISLQIHYNRIKLNRSHWYQWEELFFQNHHEDRRGEFYLFFYNEIFPNTSFILNYILLNKFRHILTDQWREYIEKQAFYFGHYEKLNRLSFIPPEYSCLITKSPAESKNVRDDLLEIIKTKQYSDLHHFLILYINKNRTLNNYEIDPENITKYLENLKISIGNEGYIPQAIRFILYLYFYKKNNLDKVNYISPYIHGKIGKFIPKLYKVRIIFKNKEYERAWQEINKIWDQDEDNMLMMNEAAIYAYHSGRIDESEILFKKLRDRYPDNPQILHNEAVFLQHKARIVHEKNKMAESRLNSRFAG